VSLARKIAENDATVLITGGKRHRQGSVRALHTQPFGAPGQSRSSPSTAPRFRRTCSRQPCSDTRRARSTGRVGAHAGKFRAGARAARCWLDEISRWTLGCRPRFLRVLQEREVERLGSSRTISLDVRLIATSNRDIPEESARRPVPAPDLYYRLKRDVAAAAGLRERPEDILPLARARHAGVARGGGRLVLSLSEEAESKLLPARLARQRARARPTSCSGRLGSRRAQDQRRGSGHRRGPRGPTNRGRSRPMRRPRPRIRAGSRPEGTGARADSRDAARDRRQPPSWPRSASA